MTSPGNDKNEISKTEFISLFSKVQEIVRIVNAYKRDQDKILLLLEGSRMDDKPSLIDAVKQLQTQIKTKADLDKTDLVLNLHETDIKRQENITENLPELEKFINKIRSLPSFILWLVLPSILTFIFNYILKLIPGK